MAKAIFKVGERKEATETRAKEIAQERDGRNAQFTLNAETGAVLKLTGKFFESVWTREEQGKDPQTGSILSAEAENGRNPKVYIPFGFFISKARLASGNEKVEFPAVFGKFTTYEDIIKFVKTKPSVKVARDYYFREGWSSETEITTVVKAE